LDTDLTVTCLLFGESSDSLASDLTRPTNSMFDPI